MTTQPVEPAWDYDSASRRPPLAGEFMELVRYRDLLQLMIAKITTTRYKRSVLGALWTLLNPLMNMVVLTIAFSALFRSSVEHYPVYVLSGLIMWNFFMQSTTFAMNSLVWGGGLIKRIYLPRPIFAVAAIGNGLINLGLALIPLVLVMLAVGHVPSPALLFLPVAILLWAMFALGVALGLSALAVFFADVVDMYQVVMQAVFYLTPIMYPRNILPEQFAWTLALNPFYYLLELFRGPIYAGTWPALGTIAAAAGMAGVTLLVGWWAFTRKADEFAYRI